MVHTLNKVKKTHKNLKMKWYFSENSIVQSIQHLRGKSDWHWLYTQ